MTTAVATPPPPPAKPADQPAKAPRPARARRGWRAPVLLETVYSVSVVVVILAGVVTAGISVFAGAPLWLTTLRAGAATLVIGLLLWVLYYLVLSDGLLVAVDEWMAKTKQEMAERAAQAEREAQAAAEPGENVLSTQEWKA